MSQVCSLFRQDDNFRRFFAMFSWFLKIFTLVVFFATIRMYDQPAAIENDDETGEEDENGAEDEQPRRARNYPRRPRRGYRSRYARAG